MGGIARDEITIDLNNYRTAAQRLASLIPSYRRKLTATLERGAKRGLHDALDEWKRLSTDLAPMEYGPLRRSIKTEVNGEGLDMDGVIAASAKNGTFDYALYIHDRYPHSTFRDPTTPGTIPEFIKKPGDENRDDWIRMVEDEIKAELRANGYSVR